jgi:ABC-type Fe3+-hydroxamate transport system substrate-binding protein
MKNREKKFIELAEKRMTRLIKQIKLVGNLSNKSNYIYTDKQANKIIKTLNDELNDVKQKFRNGSNNKQSKFKL